MLLLHQIGSVKIGEVVRYTVTYTPSDDRILPSPQALHLRIRNTCAIPLRAAFVHGPYTLSVAAYPSQFNPNEKFENPRRYGVPEFEPMLKPGGYWGCQLLVPDNIRPSAGTGSQGHPHDEPGHEVQAVSWVIEVASQVVFSASASVHYEVLLARDEKSLNMGSSVPVISNQAQVPQPGRVSDYQQSMQDVRYHVQPKGVFSRAIKMKIEDTAALWNTPQVPGWDEGGIARAKAQGAKVAVGPAPEESRTQSKKPTLPRKTKKVHLVVLTHGLHSNLGADMLFLKESIDAGVRQAKVDAKKRRAREKAEREETEPSTSAQPDGDDYDDDEDVLVRGFSGNATRTERGIKYLGKRMARYVLSMTYPDQPFLPIAKPPSGSVAQAFKGSSSKPDPDGKPSHRHSTIHRGTAEDEDRLYKITKITFIGHSLGGLIQTYAIAYIQKHSPQFFDLIEPINFIAMASPFLGLNHENPLYVKAALDFGLVGRTGQDLGLTWRAPTLARSGWGALVSNLGENAHKKVMGEVQPESKPLLRILPTGPAHTALRKFRNRTVYSNVVNDGIVPLRTSCLLFLDWQGLGRVDKARREAGLVETVVGFGWAELTGANVTSPRLEPWAPDEERAQSPAKSGDQTPVEPTHAHEVPQPSENATLEDDRQSLDLRAVVSPALHEEGPAPAHQPPSYATTNNSNPFTGFFSLFRNNDPPKSPPPSQKQYKIYQRSQTLKIGDNSSTASASSGQSRVTSGHELSEDLEGVSAPPRTSFFESAGDLLNPKMPTIEHLIDPSKRPRTIFHDRVYHPADIPPPPLKKLSTPMLGMPRRSSSKKGISSQASRSNTFESSSSSPFPSPSINHQDSLASAQDYDDTLRTNPGKDPDEVVDSSGMKVEEKIARAYHRGLSWRKVLVKLEPDAHNNIVVRRTFANAFGWPVVKHLVDAHFSDSEAARTRDEDEESTERARNIREAPDEHGGETRTEGPDKEQPPSDKPETQTATAGHSRARTMSGVPAEEALDTVSDLIPIAKASVEGSSGRPSFDHRDSATWSDRDWADSGDESDFDVNLAYGRSNMPNQHPLQVQPPRCDRAAREGEDQKKKKAKRNSSPLSGAWNWTEKIVGKGSAASSSRGGPKSPRNPPEGGDHGDGDVGVR